MDENIISKIQGYINDLRIIDHRKLWDKTLCAIKELTLAPGRIDFYYAYGNKTIRVCKVCDSTVFVGTTYLSDDWIYEEVNDRRIFNARTYFFCQRCHSSLRFGTVFKDR